MKDYSKIARPLNSLTAFSQFSPADWKRPFNEKWSSECEEAFQTLIQRLTTALVLGFANPRKPYILHTDASLHGLGAALYQEQEGKLCRKQVIAYASRGLSNCERRYPVHKLEFLALKWAVTDKFFDFLYGAKFVLMTDNNPLTYVLTSAKLDAAGHRWLAALSSFDFSIEYRAGKKNQDADGLSRRPHTQNECDHSSKEEDDRIQQFISRFVRDGLEPEFSKGAVKAVCQRHNVYNSSDSEDEADGEPTIVECLAMSEEAIPSDFFDFRCLLWI